MTRKHFVAIAASIRAEREAAAANLEGETRTVALGVIDRVARSLVADLAATNPRFDRGRFLDACGVA